MNPHNLANILRCCGNQWGRRKNNYKIDNEVLKTFTTIMKPAKLWIDGAVYKMGDGTQNSEQYKIISTDKRHSTTFSLPILYCNKMYNDMRYKFAHIKKSESTDILIPEDGNLGQITISAETILELIQAREAIHSLVQSIRNDIKPRQFVAIPTLSAEIQENFKAFKNDLLMAKIQGLDEIIFQKPEKLHITVCVFALLDQAEIQQVKYLLNELKNTVIAPMLEESAPVKVHLKGVDCMKGNLKKANILFAKASIVNETESFNLQKVANRIADFFYDKGFMKEIRDEVKIHVTLINTKYRQTKGHSKYWRNRTPFNAIEIVNKYKDYDFGICDLDSIHLSLMSKAPAEGSDGEVLNNEFPGFYTPLSVLTIIN